MSKPMPRIGVDMLFYAKVISDNAEGTVYGTPVRLEGVNNIGYNPNTQSASYDADDGTYVSYSADGEVQTTLEVANLDPTIYADIMGLKMEGGIIKEGASDNAPEIAIGFRSQKSDGSYRFIWITKGKCQKQQENYTTKGGSGITFQPTSIVHIAENRASDGVKRIQLDSNSDGVALTVAQLSDVNRGWFSTPNFTLAGYTPTSTPLAVTAATGTSASGDIVVSWGTAPSQASAIEVQVSQGTEWVAVGNPAVSSTTFTISGLTAGAEYLCRVFVTGGAKAGYSNISAAKAKA